MTSVRGNTDSATDSLDQLKHAAAPAIKEGRRRARVLLDKGGDLIDSISTRASETTADLGKGLLGYAKKNPLTALLLAVGAGALLVSATKSIHSRR